MLKPYRFGLTVNDNDYTNENDENDEWILIDWCETNTDSGNKDDEVAIRLSCFTHSLQLAIFNRLRDTPYLSKSLLKCIKLARRSNVTR